ncbi:MAG: hypothetical protein J2P57_15685 [Acidimicrobiaceae bacterium]|nr:hypothetical protein [Acidimicrobiaceae bacterium]
MPIETDHHTPWGRERYRFHPWYERPLTDRQLRVVLVASWSLAAVLVVAAGMAVWVAGWSARWLVEPIVLVFVALLAVAGRDIWADLPVRRNEEL